MRAIQKWTARIVASKEAERVTWPFLGIVTMG